MLDLHLVIGLVVKARLSSCRGLIQHLCNMYGYSVLNLRVHSRKIQVHPLQIDFPQCHLLLIRYSISGDHPICKYPKIVSFFDVRTTKICIKQ